MKSTIRKNAISYLVNVVQCNWPFCEDHFCKIVSVDLKMKRKPLNAVFNGGRVFLEENRED